MRWMKVALTLIPCRPSGRSVCRAVCGDVSWACSEEKMPAVWPSDPMPRRPSVGCRKGAISFANCSVAVSALSSVRTGINCEVH